ncbi:MAG: RNA polymerase sigma factor [Candidatus Dormibacteria bacterium]
MKQVTVIRGTSDLDLARSGDREAMARLLEPLLDPGYRLAYAILRRREAAQDALQDSCLNAMRALARFRGAGDRLRPWFLTIVANNCRSQLRRPFFRWLPLPELAGQGDDAERVAMRHDLAQGLGALHPKHRQALALFYYLDLPLAEVAEILGLSEPAAKSRLYRAVGELRKRLQAVEGDT